MNPELKLAYEQIDNQILRILLIFGGVTIATLSGALAYLWHQWRAEQRERLVLDREATQANTALAVALKGLTDKIDTLLDDAGHQS